MNKFEAYVQNLSQAETRNLLEECLSMLTLPDIIEALNETLKADDLDELCSQLSNRS